MEEKEFIALADEALERLMAALERLQNEETADFDFEMKPGGILEIDCGVGGKIIVNRHAAAREIWVAARSGGYHFRPERGRWIGTRDGADWADVLSRCLSEQTGASLRLDC
ncbi:MAG: iron donor protein CyaY [Rhodocyclaceae bacterium]|nr:iron donor protein CyaY [Rhodocyclaceae bacterium]